MSCASPDTVLGGREITVTCRGAHPGQHVTAVGQGSGVGVVDSVVSPEGTLVVHGVRATSVLGAAQVRVVATDGIPFDVTTATTVVASRTGLPFTGAVGVSAGAGVGVVAVLSGVLLVQVARRRRLGSA